MPSKTSINDKAADSLAASNGMKQMAAGEFKAKCLEAMAEVAKTGQPLLVTKRGEPFVEIGPPRQAKRGERTPLSAGWKASWKSSVTRMI